MNKVLLQRLAKYYDEWSVCVAIWLLKVTTLPKLKISLLSVIHLIKRQSFIHLQMHILRSSVAILIKTIRKPNQHYKSPSNYRLIIDMYTSNQLSSVSPAIYRLFTDCDCTKIDFPTHYIICDPNIAP